MTRVIIIDDEDQQDVIERLDSLAKKNRIEAEFLQFNVGSSFERMLLSNNKIDVEKVKTAFEERFRGKIDLICFDYNLADERINGIDLLQNIKPLRKNTSTLVYSGQLEFIIRDIIQSYRRAEPDTLNKATAKIKAMIRPGMEGFVDRTNYDDVIIKILKRRRETLDGIFEEKLAEYPDFSIDFFDGWEINSVRQMLDETDEKAMQLKRDIVEQLIAYIIRLQDEE